MVSEDSLEAISLRDYQVNAANLALANRRGVIKCATGGGKTAIFSAILKSLEETQWPTLVLARRTALIDQAYDALRRYGVKEVGRIHGSIFEPKLITVSTVQSLGKIMDEWKLKAKVLIVDEVHEMTTTQSMQIMQGFENATYRLGFSATPFVANDEIRNYRLKGLFGPLLCDISTSELQGQDVLSTSQAHFHYIDEPKRGLRAARVPFQQIEEAGIVFNEHFHQVRF
jgi:superfamily II DNA or RNA helicase